MSEREEEVWFIGIIALTMAVAFFVVAVAHLVYFWEVPPHWKEGDQWVLFWSFSAFGVLSLTVWVLLNCDWKPVARSFARNVYYWHVGDESED